ncbi:hypothetical protein ACFE04_000867 [Oxalis oulophora]
MVCVSISTEIAEKMSWYCAILMAVMLVLSCCESSDGDMELAGLQPTKTTMMNINRGCDEIYVVKEGETLQTISEKCGDPYIVEENPHVNDPDDVFPGLVIRITPYIKTRY